MITVEGKSVIVTGAADGVGLAIARRFVEYGANVMMCDRDEDQIAAAIAGFRNARGKTAMHCGDLREKLNIANLLAATIDAYDRVDILVNATTAPLVSGEETSDEDALAQNISQLVTIPLRLTQVVARRMMQQAEARPTQEPAGAVVNLCSLAAHRTLPELLPFSVAASAQEQLTRSQAAALAAHGIRVNGIAIGSVLTTSLRACIRDDDTLQDRMIAATPLGRLGEADEAAEAAVFLASNGASFITGQILSVDGGRSILDRMDQPAA